jgi:cytochrome bd ubiquinol oxidase subunit I
VIEHVLAARAQMGTSLAFHFVFSALGIGMPLMLVIVEGLWLRTKRTEYLRIARSWTKAMAVLFAIGAVSGTIISFELGLLWPIFMRYAGGIIGIPFSAEGFAFFVEAVFVGIYLYGWNRLSPIAHWLCGLPIALSGALSGLFVVCANAWMNTPAGFRFANGTVTDIHPWIAMFNPAWKTEVLHTLLASYVFVAFAVAAVSAIGAMRGNRDALAALRVAMIVALIAAPLQIVAGDLSAKFDAHNEPQKLAALEGQFRTQAGAPLRIGGLPISAEHRVAGAVEIPRMLSWLAYGEANATVRGLDSFAPDTNPPVVFTHVSFQLMVGCGFALVALALWWAIATRLGRRAPNGWLARGLVAGGFLGGIAMEAGWMVTEEGRQPWIVHSYWRTADVVTPASGLDITFLGFTAVYILLSIALVWLLLRITSGTRTIDAT